MLKPSYENYTLPQLYDALDNIDQENYPENYQELVSMIKKRKSEGEDEPSDEELAHINQNAQRNYRLKKRFFYIGISLVFIIIVLNVLSYFEAVKNNPNNKLVGIVNEMPKVTDVIGSPIESNGEPVGRIKQQFSRMGMSEIYEYEVPIKGSKLEASIFYKYTKKNDNIQYDYVYVKAKDSDEKIELDAEKLSDPKPQFGRGSGGGRPR